MPPELSSQPASKAMPLQPPLPSTSALLVQGGDHRIEIQPDSQINKYGCQPFPAADRIAFGSSTASQISPQAFEAADKLRDRIAAALAKQSAVDIYREEMASLRLELLELCGFNESSSPDVIFSASGTDAHLLASHLVAAQARRAQRALRVIMVNPEESGSGVSAALNCRSQDAEAAGNEVVHVSIRHADGAPRTAEEIIADVDLLSGAALESGLDVLLVLIDVSKTGCVAPDPQFARQLRQRWPQRLHVLVDACQFRMEAATLRAYLQQDFMIAMTGSKFIGGPSFSAALLIPQSIAASMRPAGVPAQLEAHCAQEEWPAGWHAEKTLASCANFGLLLRWEAALCELRALRAVPANRIRKFLQSFGAAVQHRLQADPHFQALAVPALPKRAAGLVPEWDDVPSIHPFTLHRRLPQPGALNRLEVADVYWRLQQTRHVDGYMYSVGQPVACGNRENVELCALRLCVSAGMIVQACAGSSEQNAQTTEMLIASAMACFDAIVALIAMS
jgi:selenocysteine lyase/cysteine desulfurase